MEPFAGLIGAILVSILCITAAKLVGTGATVGGHDILNVAIAIHITAWILQFIGHGLFEGTVESGIKKDFSSEQNLSYFKHKKKPLKKHKFAK